MTNYDKKIKSLMLNESECTQFSPFVVRATNRMIQLEGFRPIFSVEDSSYGNQQFVVELAKIIQQEFMETNFF